MRGTGAGEPPGLGFDHAAEAIPPQGALLLFGYAPKEVPLEDCARGLGLRVQLAERVGFEPTVVSLPRRFSRPVP